jgi:hypothetical protein
MVVVMTNKMKYKKQTMMSALTLSFLLTTQAYATSSVESDFELVLPRSFQQKLIEQKWITLAKEKFSINWQIPDQVLKTSTVDVSLQDLHLDLSTYLTKPQLSSGKSALSLESKNLAGTLKMGLVSVDQYIEREVGGIIGRFRIQAQCRDVVLTAVAGKSSFKIDLAPSTDGTSLSGKVENVDLSWQPGAWQIGALSCTGAQGFDDVVRQQVLEMANNSAKFIDPLKPQMFSYIENYLKNYELNIGEKRQLVTGRSDIEASMVADKIEDLADGSGTVMTGRVQVSFKKVADAPTEVLHLKEGSIKSMSNASIRVPDSLIPTLMGKAFKANTWLQNLSSSQIPGFSSVMNSRFVQFFAWPELMKYSKSTVFPFQLYSDKDLTLTGKGLKFNASGKLISQMLAPKGSSSVPMMRFGLPFKTDLSFSTKSGVLSMTSTNPVVSLTSSWDADYVKKYSPRTKFAQSTVLGKIQNALDTKTYTYTLPTLPIVDGLTLKVDSLETATETQSVRVILGVNP